MARTHNNGTEEPEGNYVFALEIDGVAIANFMECSGLKTSTQVFELEEGGVNHRVHKLPGQSRWENVTLRYGVTSDTSRRARTARMPLRPGPHRPRRDRPRRRSPGLRRGRLGARRRDDRDRASRSHNLLINS